jgi:hypothetical protein
MSAEDVGMTLGRQLSEVQREDRSLFDGRIVHSLPMAREIPDVHLPRKVESDTGCTIPDRDISG